MIRDPASFHILPDTIARLVREKLIPREHEVTETDEIPADIIGEFEAEQRLVAANLQLIARFEKKIQATLARVYQPLKMSYIAIPCHFCYGEWLKEALYGKHEYFPSRAA